jgi:hypothetical protein
MNNEIDEKLVFNTARKIADLVARWLAITTPIP